MPNPEGRVLMEDGLIFESGEVKDNKELIDPTQGILESSLDYNEFIVYDVGQVINMIFEGFNFFLGQN